MGRGECAACGQDLPSGARKDARYCGTNCRSRAYRRRKSPRPRETQSAEPSVLDAARLARDEATSAASQGAPERPRTSEGTSPPASPARVQPAQEPRPAAAAPRRRVALSHQIRSQAPAGAAGYRLVLPPAAAGERPRLAPRKRAGESRGVWSLDPLQLPNDRRLQDGQVYRIRWVDENGQPIAPTPGAGVSALYYFLGPADCSGDPLEDELQALLALTSDRPEHAELRAAVLQKRAARLDALLAAERDRELQASAARSQAESRRVQRELRASLKELERVRRRQERRAARQARAIDWVALAPLMNAVVAALGEAGCAYYALRPSSEELTRQGKPAPLMLLVAQRFLEALKAQLAAQGPDLASSQPASAPEEAASPAPTVPASEGKQAGAEPAAADVVADLRYAYRATVQPLDPTCSRS